MGLYAIMLSTIQKIEREHWGSPVSLDDLQNGQSKDPGLQSFVDELKFALSDKGVTKMPETWKIQAPANGPAFQIDINNDNNESIVINNTTTNETINLTEVINNITNITDIATSGFTGSFTIPQTFTISIVGCAATITVATAITVTVSKGLITGAG